MSDNASSPFSWIIGLLLVVAAVYFWRISLGFAAVAILLGLALWAGYALISKSGRAQAAMARNDYAAALLLLQESGNADQLISALRFKVPFPTEESEARMVEAVRQLLALKDAAADPANPHIPDELREDIDRRTGESLESLWPLCHKLSLLARSKVASEVIEDRVADVTEQLGQLARNAESTRQQLAHITLGASELEINLATEQVGAMKWQVNEMRKLDTMLEG